jgi:hypothetical protein
MSASNFLSALALVLLLGAIVVRLPLAEGRDRKKTRDRTVEEIIEVYASMLSQKRPPVRGILKDYGRLESKKELTAAERYRIHRLLLTKLKALRGSFLRRIVHSTLAKRSKKAFASQVLVMKVIVDGNFKAKRSERVKWLSKQTRHENVAIASWGLKLLGDTRWPEAVEALLEIMEEEEEGGRTRGHLWHGVSAELHRLLGARNAMGTAAAVRESWAKMSRVVPERPDYSLLGPHKKSARTIVFFGDKISPRSVFVIDTSTSMRRKATLRASFASPAQTDPSKRMAVKVDIVKRELERALSSLQLGFEFNVLAYNSDIHPWKDKDGLELHPVNSENLESAQLFARTLPTNPGTNIYDSLRAALSIERVDTVYLLSDGRPSVGGGQEAIVRDLKVWNYLVGARIVTYGLAEETGKTFDEGFMKGLAESNRGWYRRLNQLPKPKKKGDTKE